MTRHITLYEGEIDEVRIPARWEICGRCHGEGHHGNPAFDGTTTDWWLDGDPDGENLDDYVSGRWDVPCEERCEGGRILVPDETRATPEQIAEYDEYQRDKYQHRAEIEAEQRAGA